MKYYIMFSCLIGAVGSLMSYRDQRKTGITLAIIFAAEAVMFWVII